jgi:peptidoglycan/xylan/chitin deacetylase (PgdA/CDA1 family)
MNKKISKKILIKRSALLLSFLIIVSLIFVFATKAFAPHTPEKNTATNKIENTPLQNSAKIEAIPTDSENSIISSDALDKTQIPILMYHHIRNFTDTSDQIGINLSVTPEKFSSQLDYLKAKGYTTITFRDVEANNIPSKPIILTFDDGYQNFYDNALPALMSNGMKAVSFIIADKNGGDYMTRTEIAGLEAKGIEVGSHTLSHPDLSTISTEKAIDEIANSKTRLEAIINKPVTSICFPSGKYNDTVLKDVEDSGYLFAVTTKSGIGSFNAPFELKRYRMNADTNISGIIK